MLITTISGYSPKITVATASRKASDVKKDVEWGGMKMISILIRNISEVDIKLIDELARSKKVSREEYLRRLIHTHVATFYASDTVNDFEELTEKNLQVIKANTDVLNQIVALMND